MEITKHAAKRGKERLGLTGRALDRVCEEAREHGLKQHDTKGGLHRYLTGCAARHKSTPYVWKEHVFCVGGDGRLVTILHLPRGYKRAASKIQDKLK